MVIVEVGEDGAHGGDIGVFLIDWEGVEGGDESAEGGIAEEGFSGDKVSGAWEESGDYRGVKEGEVVTDDEEGAAGRDGSLVLGMGIEGDSEEVAC
jgi:hypothetical protein